MVCGHSTRSSSSPFSSPAFRHHLLVFVCVCSLIPRTPVSSVSASSIAPHSSWVILGFLLPVPLPPNTPAWFSSNVADSSLLIRAAISHAFGQNNGHQQAAARGWPLPSTVSEYSTTVEHPDQSLRHLVHRENSVHEDVSSPKSLSSSLYYSVTSPCRFYRIWIHLGRFYSASSQPSCSCISIGTAACASIIRLVTTIHHCSSWFPVYRGVPGKEKADGCVGIAFRCTL